ncbi:hypothetical protein QVN76_07345 [Yersinia rochesterensis]|uniref:hypothetical protein n=1 Tax=Yersinia rochesterensis TaxID=1604335 RepID=UPI0025AAA09C|nr:hypothetical protein [Yersinia rochesterensis]MDN0106706.1 hypothetical protein [Yersinia rochesterensis]
MNEKPILFNAEMVNAILSGRKTQTRRIISEKTLHLFGVAASAGECHPLELCDDRSQSYYLEFCPLGKPGDQLWVRETFASGLCTESTLAYRATHKMEDLEEGWGETIKWTPSIHMPRWASRINLLITGVRVERLRDISEQDAMAEGVSLVETPASIKSFGEAFGLTHCPKISAFANLWQSIYGSWGDNPWVWCITFERMEAK